MSCLDFVNWTFCSFQSHRIVMPPIKSLISVIILLYLVTYQEKFRISLRSTLMYKSRQPHILFVLADDYGWNDIGKEYFLPLIFEIVACISHISPLGSSKVLLYFCNLGRPWDHFSNFWFSQLSHTTQWPKTCSKICKYQNHPKVYWK